MPRTYSPLRLDDRMPFGKHAGKTVKLLIAQDPSYLAWAIEKMDGFSLDPIALQAFKERTGDVKADPLWTPVAVPRVVRIPTGAQITLGDQQHEALVQMMEWAQSPERFFTLSGFAGTGKAEPLTNVLPTPTGPRTIGSLRIGDQVFGQDGLQHLVTGVFPQGVVQTYCVSFRDGTSVEVAGEHLWQIIDRRGKSKAVTTEWLVSDGVQFDSGPYKYRVPLCEPVQTSGSVPLDGYVLGAFIGDGSALGKTPLISSADPDVIDRVLENLPEGFETRRFERANHSDYRFVWTPEVHTNPLNKVFRHYGLDVTSPNRFIPDDYFMASVEQRWALLRGLMDTDGSTRTNRTSFSTRSERLANDVVRLVQSLGGTAILSRYERESGVDFNVNVKTFENPFWLARKASRWFLSLKNGPSRYIKSVTPARKVECQCISVDAADHLYLTEGYTVTHNSTITHTLLDLASKRFPKVAVTAPTHKAKKVISRTTGKPALTVQSLLGLSPATELESFDPNSPHFRRQGTPRLLDYDLVVVDEASMMSEGLVGYFFELLSGPLGKGERRTKVLFMGDSAQLPPVGEDVSQVFASEAILRKYELTEVHRQKGDNPLKLVYDQIRENMSSRMDGFKHETRLLTDGSGIQFVTSEEKFGDLIVDAFKSEHYAKDPDHAKVVCWTNDAVKKWNEYVRGVLYGPDVDYLVVGENLMAYATVGFGDQITIENSAEYRVAFMESWTDREKILVPGPPVEQEDPPWDLDTTASKMSFGMKKAEAPMVEKKILIEMWKVVLEPVDLPEDQKDQNVSRIVNVVVPYAGNYEAFQEAYLYYSTKARAGGNGQDRKLLWQEFYHFKDRHLVLHTLYSQTGDGQKKLLCGRDLSYAYAITVHKSQGSTYDKVFVDETDINKNSERHRERNSLKYVAFSRPSKTALVLTTADVVARETTVVKQPFALGSEEKASPLGELIACIDAVRQGFATSTDTNVIRALKGLQKWEEVVQTLGPRKVVLAKNCDEVPGKKKLSFGARIKEHKRDPAQ